MTEVHGLRIYTKEGLTVVAFDEKGSHAGETFIGQATEHLESIVEEHQTKVLVVDLTGITALPSDMLGVLVGVHHRGTEVRLFNCTPEVRMILDTTNLNQLFDLREGDLSALIDASTEE